MKACITIGLKLTKLNTLVKAKYNVNYFVFIFFPFIVLNICIPKCCMLINNMGAVTIKGTTYGKV
jgi:hypothetical protein